MTLKIWSKQLLYIKPDASPYLLASRLPVQVRLLCASGVPLYWTNSRAVISNTLSGTVLARKAFEVSAYVLPAAIKPGTVELMRLDNLVSVKAQSNKIGFKFPWLDNVWKYTTPIPEGEGVVFRLTGDGIYIKLYINDEEHVLLDTSGTVIHTLCTGKRDAHIALPDTAPLSTADSWEFQTRILWNGGASYPCIIGYSGGSDYKTPCLTYEGGYIKMFLSTTGYSWDLNAAPSSFAPVSGKTYDIKAGFTGAEYYLDYKEADSTEWTRAWELESSSKVFCNVPFWMMNLSLNDYAYYNEGSMYMDLTRILVNGSVWFDGSNPSSYTNNGCAITQEADGPVYPTIDAGALNVLLPWQYINRIKAEYVEA